MNKNETRAALEEVLHEISRVNNAAGHVVFNPTATQLVREMLTDVIEGKR